MPATSKSAASPLSDRFEALKDRVKITSGRNKRFKGAAAGMNLTNKKNALMAIVKSVALDAYETPPISKIVGPEFAKLEATLAALEANPDLITTYVARYETLRFQAQ